LKTEALLPVHTLVVRSTLQSDPVAEGMLADARAIGLKSVRKIERELLYFLEGKLSPEERETLRAALLTDPLTQVGAWREKAAKPPAGAFVIEVALRPGVTDPVAMEIVRCAGLLEVDGLRRAATGTRYIIRGTLTPTQRTTLARKLLANDVIQRYAIGPIQPVFPHPAESSGEVEILPIRTLDDKGLAKLALARRAALDLEEMRAIQEYFRAEKRDPTDVEFEMIAQTWSEHCGHKTFKAEIVLEGSGEKIEGLLDTYIRAATKRVGARWVRSAFVDNAGIIDFDAAHEVSFKVETHNHPSAIEPFGGANTGTGGVIRDVLGVSAKPIAATDVLCFGPQDADPAKIPAGVLHPRRIRSGVVAGIQDYGNKIGIPTVSGAIWYDPAYTANPLVYCGCVGIAPKGKHVRAPKPGDHIILLGGRTGRDGLRGATFSSMTMDAKTGEVSGASVQIGDPITEKGLIEVLIRARNHGLYHAVTDCGAGGLSSAVGEMGLNLGVDVELREVQLKYAGLAPWEIWLSEAQERMVLAVPTDKLVQLEKICAVFDVSITDIGRFSKDGRMVVRYNSKPVLDLECEFLAEGQPCRHLSAVLPKPEVVKKHAPAGKPVDCQDVLLKLLAHPNIASKSDVIRVYDHEVQGGTTVKPLVGVENDGPSDGCVLVPIGTPGPRAISLSAGFNPEIGKADPYRMAVSVVDEAVRNAVSVGADPERIGLLDNFCFGDPLRPETLGGLVAACRGCYDAAVAYGLPFISGKDSLNNEYLGSDGKQHAIPPSLLISAVGIVEDVDRTTTMDLKVEGSTIYLLGETKDEFAGSHFHLVTGGAREGEVAPSLPDYAPALYKALHKAMTKGLVLSCHDLSEGGLAVAAAEMCLAGRLGMSLTLDADDPVVDLFSESNGRLLVEVHASQVLAFENEFLAGTAAYVRRIGSTAKGRWLNISTPDAKLISLPVDMLVEAWMGDKQ
jgi:phosphoribosylformylglycinamidine synthase